MSRMSSFEQKIYKILRREGVPFVQEKTFQDLKHGLLRYDFFLPQNNVALEIQGPHHYEFNKFFYKKRSEYLKAKERDRKKISYCLAHHIALYCIPYWEIDNLTSFSDMTQKKFLALSKFHNDEVWREHQKNR